MVGRAAYSHPLRWKNIDEQVFGDAPRSVLASDVVAGRSRMLRPISAVGDDCGICAVTSSNWWKAFAAPDTGGANWENGPNDPAPILMSWNRPACNCETPASSAEKSTLGSAVTGVVITPAATTGGTTTSAATFVVSTAFSTAIAGAVAAVFPTTGTGTTLATLAAAVATTAAVTATTSAAATAVTTSSSAIAATFPATAAAVTTSTAAITTAITTGCTATGLSLVDSERTTHQFSSLKCLNGSRLSCLIHHLNESKTTLATGVPFQGQGTVGDFTELGEQLNYIFLLCAEGRLPTKMLTFCVDRVRKRNRKRLEPLPSDLHF